MSSHPPACYQHFSRRVAERMGEDIDARMLWRSLIQIIETETETEHLQFMARINRDGRRLWRLYLRGKPFFVIYDHSIGCPITVIGPSGLVGRSGKSPIDLGRYA